MWYTLHTTWPNKSSWMKNVRLKIIYYSLSNIKYQQNDEIKLNESGKKNFSEQQNGPKHQAPDAHKTFSIIFYLHTHTHKVRVLRVQYAMCDSIIRKMHGI